MSVLVDTHVISELRRGRKAHPAVAAWSAALPPEQIFTSVVVLGGIRRGIELIARRDKSQADVLERWYAAMRQELGNRVLVVDEAVMMTWSRISVPNMLPAYDGLIAATALVHGMAVATRNAVDYSRVGVEVVDPWSGTPRL